MADVKISALPAATTPLAGTEVLPIVQSATTRQVSVANLTAGRAVSALSIATTTGATFATTSGSVGIGTVTPDAILDVTRSGNGQIAVLQTTATRGFSFESSSDTAIQIASIQASTNLDLFANTLSFSAGGSERMRITSAGLVGIGASSPSGKLQIDSANVDPSATANGITLINSTSSQATSNGGSISLGGVYTGSSITQFGYILGAKANSTDGDYAGYLSFGTRPNGDVSQERMRLDSSGNVGIGTSSPTSFGGFKSLELANSSGNAISLVTGTSVIAQTIASNTNSLVYTGTRSNHSLVITTNDTERMRIDTSGNVGIGTSSPAGKLHVMKTATGGSPQNAAGNQIVMENGDSTGSADLQFLSANNGYSHIFFGDAADANVGTLLYDHNTNSMQFVTNAAERMRIDSSGIVTMSAYGAGAATFSASGVISSVSDETWKTKDGVPTNTDAMLQKLEPGYWFYNEEKAPTFGQERQLGFYAQNVHEAIGSEAAPTPEEGKPWGYYDRSVLAVTVMSLKNALNTIEELKQRIEILENK